MSVLKWIWRISFPVNDEWLDVTVFTVALLINLILPNPLLAMIEMKYTARARAYATFILHRS